MSGPTAQDVTDATTAIRAEHDRVLDGVDTAAWARAGALVTGASAVFMVGTGRSGLARQMAAMRFMHLGLDAHVVGETTTPAIGTGDVLVAASGSGSTARVVRAAQTARDEGADVVAITTAAESPLAETATEVLIVPAADKLELAVLARSRRRPTRTGRDHGACLGQHRRRAARARRHRLEPQGLHQQLLAHRHRHRHAEHSRLSGSCPR